MWPDTPSRESFHPSRSDDASRSTAHLRHGVRPCEVPLTCLLALRVGEVCFACVILVASATPLNSANSRAGDPQGTTPDGVRKVYVAKRGWSDPTRCAPAILKADCTLQLESWVVLACPAERRDSPSEQFGSGCRQSPSLAVRVWAECLDCFGALSGPSHTP